MIVDRGKTIDGLGYVNSILPNYLWSKFEDDLFSKMVQLVKFNLKRKMPVLSFNLPSKMDFKIKALFEFFTSRE